MRLEKAIKIKLQWRKDNYPPALPDEIDADMLSIEAMKGITAIRCGAISNVNELLPGETKD